MHNIHSELIVTAASGVEESAQADLHDDDRSFVNLSGMAKLSKAKFTRMFGGIREDQNQV